MSDEETAPPMRFALALDIAIDTLQIHANPTRIKASRVLIEQRDEIERMRQVRDNLRMALIRATGRTFESIVEEFGS